MAKRSPAKKLALEAPETKDEAAKMIVEIAMGMRGSAL